MKIQVLILLAATASLFAQEAPKEAPLPCRASYEAVKNMYPRDFASGRFYASTEARIRGLEAIAKEDRKGEIYEAELKNCNLAVEHYRIQLSNTALRKNVDSLTQSDLAIHKSISAIKDSLIELWSSDAHGAKSLNAALNDERNRLEKLNKEKLAELAAKQKAIEDAQKALAEKDSLLAAQKAEAQKKLDALNSKAISVFRDARGTILSMSDILFETGKADLKQELRENLSAIGAILQSLLTESLVIVEGHTDNVGSADFNQKLSEQRAHAVMQYLIERGVAANRMKAIGYGLTKPVADNKTKEGQARNRRVELVIKD
ncbi:MAG: OmpA family protein [Fibromonadaceae bacterium]|jgi:outer membrane protein OmpA-like peptidoglycan-associated protein|nr:OmpA family protein [Fibromonadaceae bacterium]